MKKLILLTSMLFMGGIAFAQTKTTTPTTTTATATTYKWNSTTHDFGKIEQNKPAQCEFKITNNGKTALVITNASPSCGCTVPEFTKEPIPAGQSGFVKATYNAAAVGQFTKSITVTLSTGATEILTIKGEVLAAKGK
jgi:hypothetical protein